MLRVVSSTAGPHGAKSYFDASLTRGDYYCERGEIVGKWGGRGAQLLGLRGKEITRADFHAMCDGNMPGTNRRLTARKNRDDRRTVGYDLVFDADKSFSALWALTRDEALVDMFARSVEETMADIEKHMLVRVRARGDIQAIKKGTAPGLAREKKCNGKDGKAFHRTEYVRQTENLCYGTFIHSTTRPVEDPSSGKTFAFPQVHAHAFTFNATFDEHGRGRGKNQAQGVWKAGLFEEIKRNANYFNARFQARLTRRLTDAGYPIQRDGKRWRIAGVPQSLMEKFSARTREIEREAARLGITDPRAKGELGAKTRLKKETGMPLSKLHRLWWHEVADRKERAAMNRVARKRQKVPQKSGAGAQAVDAAIAHSYERASVIEEVQLAQAALEFGMGQVLPEAIDRELSSRSELLRQQRELRTLVTTKAVYDEETALLSWVRRSHGTCARLHPGGYRFMARTDGEGKPWALNDQQQAAVLMVLHSNDRVNIIRGAAGTGKSSALEDLKRALAEVRVDVHGFAPTTKATHGLAKKGFGRAQTVQMLLANPKLQDQVAGGVILVDEAGLLSVPQMKALCNIARKQDARLVLVGDRRQHRSIERGDSLSLLEDHGGITPASLTKMHRQRQNPTYARATKAVEETDFDAAMAALEVERSVARILRDDQQSAIVEFQPGDRGLFDQIALDAVRLREAGHSVIIDTPINRNGELISEKINALLEEKGSVNKRGTIVQRLRTAGLTEAERKDPAFYRKGQVVCIDRAIPKMSKRAVTLSDDGTLQKVGGNRWHKQRSLEKGEKLTVLGRHNDHVIVADHSGKALLLPTKHADRFDVYNTQDFKITGGRRIRFRRGGKTTGGHQLVNGYVYTVDSVTRGGDIRLDNGWIVPKDYGHWTYGEYGTSHMNQGADADFVLMDQSRSAFGATNARQFYVSVTRGKKGVRIYTDAKGELAERIRRCNARMSATELLEQRRKRSLALVTRARAQAGRSAAKAIHVARVIRGAYRHVQGWVEQARQHRSNRQILNQRPEPAWLRHNVPSQVQRPESRSQKQPLVDRIRQGLGRTQGKAPTKEGKL